MTAGVGDGLDSIDLSDDLRFGNAKEPDTPLWNGRDVELQTWKHHQHTLVSQFHIKVLEEAKELANAQIRHRSYELAQEKPSAPPKKSCYIKTEGFTIPGKRIGFINGMAASFEETLQHLEHIRKFAGGMCIEGIYNHSNSALIDALEVFLLNYRGIAPVTGKLLIKEWTRFHKENKNNPNAKYLQFAHSQGTILTEIALMNAPREIRDRVIVVAIGTAVIIPEKLCFHSYHYASKNDFVHFGENIPVLGAFDSPHKSGQAEILEKFLENKKRLILLDSDPKEKGMKHDFDNPIFAEVIEGHINEYLNNNGQYR